MQNQPDWGKRGVFAAYIIGFPTLLLAAFAYFRPPDPAHPITFDFLFRTVSIPIWLIVLLLIIAMGLALARRILSPRITKSTLSAATVVEPERAKPSVVIHPPANPPKAQETPKTSGVVIQTDTMLGIHIAADNTSEAPFIYLRIDNRRLGAIDGIDLVLQSAFSFDSEHGQFRTYDPGSGVRIPLGIIIPPKESSHLVPIVSRPLGRNYLQLGNEASRMLKWPANDKTVIQRWKVIGWVTARAYSRTQPPTGEVFQPAKLDLIVDWDTTSNRMSVQKA